MPDRNYIRSTDEGTLLTINVQPRANKTEFAGIKDGSLKVRLTAPPIDGKANEECVRFIAKAFGISKSRVQIVQGIKSRQKTVLIRDVTPETVEQLLG
jgi:uncharacterized protein (TIGR00251 family)